MSFNPMLHLNSLRKRKFKSRIDQVSSLMDPIENKRFGKLALALEKEIYEEVLNIQEGIKF